MQGVAAYVLWGLLPLYLKLLHGVPAIQVLSHRVLWSVVLLLGVIIPLKRGGAIFKAARGRTMLLLCASAALITINWLTYIWAVLNNHVLEASLGYFINPLINVALGVIVLRERISAGQLIAVGLAIVGVAITASMRGGMLWIPITVALSFALYGLIRKTAAIDALGGLTVETSILVPFAITILLHADYSGQGAFGQTLRLDLLLMTAGVVTALPLLLFAAAARRLPLTTIGIIQYLQPTLAFLEAVLLFNEPIRPVELLAFAFIWSGCALYSYQSVRTKLSD